MSFYKKLIAQSISRSKEATLSMLRISDAGLREHISSAMTNNLGSEDCFLSQPVIEHTFGWEQGNKTFRDLEDSLLSKDFLDTLENGDEYKFSRNMKPYKHQLKAWNTLTEIKPKSIVVTTGTGSGKTECFMIPIIQDLINEYKAKHNKLVGVRALFLYPLNALINSQQERLNEWTRDYDDNIRFCLYNGKTPNSEHDSDVRKNQQIKKNQILSRDLLRKEPAPILMTNGTMLEYMLVRQIDNPILEISREQKSLKYIVLDEAHTYVGSQAAEVSLLLRRVVQAFGKKSEEIRFIATSATIADEDAEEKLQKYLAQLAGVSVEQVEVITGKRVWPSLENNNVINKLSSSEISEIEQDLEVSKERFAALNQNYIAQSIRDFILSSGSPNTVTDIKNELLTKGINLSEENILEWIDIMSGTKEEEKKEPFLKLRLHLFQRMFHGLWSCVDPNCTHRSDNLKNWGFGNVYVSQRTKCDCGAPVFEVGFCTDCNESHLISADNNGYLKQLSQYTEDEFKLLDDETSDINEQEERLDKSPENKIVLAPVNSKSEVYMEYAIDKVTSELIGIQNERTIRIKMVSEWDSSCSSCEYKNNNLDGFMRYAYLGSPFYIANAVPTVLEYCPDAIQKESDGKTPEELPGRGRKLITFTDSRQGTARMAVRMQQEAERSKLRGNVYEVVKNIQNSEVSESKTYEELMALYNHMKQFDSNEANKYKAVAEKVKDGTTDFKKITWDDLIQKLSTMNDISRSILRYNKYSNPALFADGGEEKIMARLLLTREFARRPKNQNSLESLGIIKVSYDGLDKELVSPLNWESTSVIKKDINNEEYTTKLTLDDWRDFLKVSLDFYVRENSFVRLDPNTKLWMGSRFYPKEFISPTSISEESISTKKWPTIKKGPANRLVKLLEEATGLDRHDNLDKDKINMWLSTAWKNLVDDLKILTNYGEVYSLDLEKLTFSFNSEAWICPVTNRLFDTTFCGLTPYLPNSRKGKNYSCIKVKLPGYKDLTVSSMAINKIDEIRKLVKNNEEINNLRSNNLWTDLSDRIIEGGFYYRTAEHSAQQSAKKLDDYVEWFKKGTINVLNCSTTMEMGVDIGGVSSVVMNNVPPHPANYLQRSGRAGRRSESRAIAYTLCKADPHNQRAFSNPKWPFVTAIPAPNITLSSKRIIERHVNSLLLATFLRKNSEENNGDRTKLTVAWFYGGANSKCREYMEWLLGCEKEVKENIKDLVRGTCLELEMIRNILQDSYARIEKIEEKWLSEYNNIKDKAENLPNSRDPESQAFKIALDLELKNHESEYLLRSLSTQAYLPVYGFPTNVVNLNNYNVDDFINKRKKKIDRSREDNIFDYKELPSRSLDIAISEYAPGSQIVIDGRVYTSHGVSIDWKAPDIHATWYCQRCGKIGVTEKGYSGDITHCIECHSPLEYNNKKQYLKPLGFRSDFFSKTTNDVTSQKFIKADIPRVLLSQHSEVSLPDYRCGFIRFGGEGKVLYQSSGEFNNGFAICLKCGRAESMTKTGEIPKNLQPGKEHYPLGGIQDPDNKVMCSGGHVKKDLNLGYNITTDVIELVIKNPKIENSWLGISNRDKKIASTLAVAIRDSIADYLGIASTEMGFATKQEKDIDTGVIRSVIQIYDKASGGAGFCKAALEDIQRILKGAIKKLVCPKGCENVCSHCLAGNDSRVERNELDRHLALEWTKDTGYLDHLKYSDDFAFLKDAKYCSYGPFSYIESSIRSISASQTKDLYIYFNSENDQHDYMHTKFIDKVLRWKYEYSIMINFVFPEYFNIQELDNSIIRKIRDNYITLYTNRDNRSKSVFISCSIESDDKSYNLYSNNYDSNIPGVWWLNPVEPATWVSSKESVTAELIEIDLPELKEVSANAFFIQINNDLNGPVSTFNFKFKDLIKSHSTDFYNKLNSEKITQISYYDRYLRTPWNILLLGKLIEGLQGQNSPDIEINTSLDHRNCREGYYFDHNWSNSNHMQKVSESWLTNFLGSNVDFHIVDSRDLPHGRTLTMTWESGETSEIIFDQGLGAWKPSYTSFGKNKFQFYSSVNEQIEEIESKINNINVAKQQDWATYITIV